MSLGQLPQSLQPWSFSFCSSRSRQKRARVATLCLVVLLVSQKLGRSGGDEPVTRRLPSPSSTVSTPNSWDKRLGGLSACPRRVSDAPGTYLPKSTVHTVGKYGTSSGTFVHWMFLFPAPFQVAVFSAEPSCNPLHFGLDAGSRCSCCFARPCLSTATCYCYHHLSGLVQAGIAYTEYAFLVCWAVSTTTTLFFRASRASVRPTLFYFARV